MKLKLKETLSKILHTISIKRTTLNGENGNRIGDIIIVLDKIIIISCTNDQGSIPTTGLSTGFIPLSEAIVPCSFYDGSADTTGFLRYGTDGILTVFQPRLGNKSAQYTTCQLIAVLA